MVLEPSPFDHSFTSEYWEVEEILRNAAAGNPLPASDATVAFPYSNPPYYTATWGGGDYGKGFLFADAVMKAAP